MTDATGTSAACECCEENAPTTAYPTGGEDSVVYLCDRCAGQLPGHASSNREATPPERRFPAGIDPNSADWRDGYDTGFAEALSGVFNPDGSYKDATRNSAADAGVHRVDRSSAARASRCGGRVTLCAYCGQPISVASNPLGQTPIAYYHGECYRLEHPPEHPAQPIHLMSHDELVQDGHLFP